VTPQHITLNADRVIMSGCTGVPMRPGAHSLYSDDPHEIQQWLSTHVHTTNTRVALCIVKGHPRYEEITRVCAVHQMLANIDQQTLEQKLASMGEQCVAGLHRLRHAPWVNALGEPCTGAPVFVVGAGPSLDRNKHLLARAATKGYVFAVNTSAGAVPSELDAVFCAENLDVSSGLAKRAGETLHILQAHAHPACWDVPCSAQAVFQGADPQIVPYVLEAGGIPIPHSSGVTGAAAAVGLLWGASEVVLVGQDLAYGADKAYASGSAFDDIEVVNDGSALRFAGASKQMHPTEHIEVEAWGGGTVATSPGWIPFIRWWAEVAEKVPITNATEGGARIEHAREESLTDVLDRLPDLDWKWDLAEVARGARTGDGAVAIERIAAEGQRLLDASDRDLRRVALGAPIAAFWTYPDACKLDREGGLTMKQRDEAHRASFRRAGARMVELAR